MMCAFVLYGGIQFYGKFCHVSLSEGKIRSKLTTQTYFFSFRLVVQSSDGRQLQCLDRLGVEQCILAYELGHSTDCLSNVPNRLFGDDHERTRQSWAV